MQALHVPQNSRTVVLVFHLFLGQNVRLLSLLLWCGGVRVCQLILTITRRAAVAARRSVTEEYRQS
jgi:hypothetical protein